MLKEIIANSNRHETRIAVLEDNLLAELLVERKKSRSIVGNIYKGKVTKVLPGMQSAFVNIGLEKDSFLYVSDVLENLDEYEKLLLGNDIDGPDEEEPPAFAAGQRRQPKYSIDELLREGQELLVQVSKEPLGNKGARITSHITFPGKYLVYMPTVEHIGVSRKIRSDQERDRLKKIISSIERPQGGYIVRTAGDGVGEAEFCHDRDFLHKTWMGVKRKAERNSAPSLIHRDLDLLLKILRDFFTPDYAKLRIDSETDYQRALDFLNKIQPSMVNRVQLYNRQYPIFEAYGIEAEIEKALRNKVWLKSGGYIVINPTEALVAIDVNTGKFVGKHKLEDTVVRINLEACVEIVRQIRLRDLGGIIVIDLIDMESESNRRKVLQALEVELEKDRSQTKTLQISDFGLVEITRKRVKKSLGKLLCQPCPYCGGKGSIKTVHTICNQIQSEISKLRSTLSGKELVIHVHPDVAEALQSEEGDIIKELEDMLHMKVHIKSDPNHHHEQFDMMNI